MLGLLLCFALVGCGRADDASRPVAIPARLDAEPSIVSLSPLATRFVVAIGAGRQLVGVDPASGDLPAPDLAALPRVGLAGAVVLEPDLVLAPPALAGSEPERVDLVVRGAEFFEFSPHDLEDVFALCRGLGARLVGEEGARRFESAISRPLAEIGGSSYGRPRPRVLAVVGLDPLELAGGHSFETDLIEIAGGQSVTHGGDETRLPVGPDPWAQFDPDVLLVMLPHEPPPEALRDAFGDVPHDVALRFFQVEAETFWLEPDQASAHRLRALIGSFE